MRLPIIKLLMIFWKSILHAFESSLKLFIFYCIGCNYTISNLIMLDKNILTLLKYIYFLLLSGLFLLLLLLYLFNALNTQYYMLISIILKRHFTLLAVHYTVQLSEVCYFIFNEMNKFIYYNKIFDPKNVFI